MPLKLTLSENITCPECKGAGDLYNPEYQKMALAKDEWYHTTHPEPTPAERDAWENNYWIEQGYKPDATGFVAGAWDLKSCPECLGTGAYEVEQTLMLKELAQLLKEEGETDA